MNRLGISINKVKQKAKHLGISIVNRNKRSINFGIDITDRDKKIYNLGIRIIDINSVNNLDIGTKLADVNKQVYK